MSRTVDVLIDFLGAEISRGKSHVFLDQEARSVMRALQQQVRSGPQDPPAAPLPSARKISGPAPLPHIPDGDKATRLAALRERAETWPPAIALGSLRTIMVFASGDPDAELMLVGEAPGHHEEKQREPFVGPAGQKLNDILRAMGLSREAVYISNLVKFRPSLPRQTTNNRKPTKEEMAACRELVLAEISIVRPKLVIALGATAAEGLLGLDGTVASMRGSWHEVNGFPARVTYHPSYLLQSGGSTTAKRALWEDMLVAMERLGLPISEKQQSYFLPKP